MIHFDTSFVVDFLRETSRDDPGPATALLDSLPPEDLAVSVFAVCELLAGAALAQRGDEERRKVREFCATLRIAYPDDAFADQYGRIVGTLKRSAVREGARLVTRDRKDFLDIAGLDLISY